MLSDGSVHSNLYKLVSDLTFGNLWEMSQEFEGNNEQVRYEFGHDNNDTQMMIMKESIIQVSSAFFFGFKTPDQDSLTYDFIQGRSSGTSDTEFQLRGDGEPLLRQMVHLVVGPGLD